MTIRVDPENNEPRALFNMADFNNQHVLEIGCGDGRLTWRYANTSTNITAIDPSAENITRARENLPDKLKEHIEFHHTAFEDFATYSEASTFDRVILSWSL